MGDIVSHRSCTVVKFLIYPTCCVADPERQARQRGNFTKSIRHLPGQALCNN